MRMSCPRSIGSSVREEAEVMFRETIACLHNSSLMLFLRFKSYGGNSVSKSVEHEVKIRFAREFADVGSITHSTPESLSPASSFQSLSILSTKSICTDFVSSQILDDS
ncbi:hypothetical protein K0M31_008584 [Melipona bicolor]|uniref:Uncharacterized protein n=1 Tax=Melipona bicolor TaxID=60889 RepID=A0AA40FQE5_9HYME|nr:hypothetical protein K0M31_008584 [Melipona bicolor]